MAGESHVAETLHGAAEAAHGGAGHGGDNPLLEEHHSWVHPIAQALHVPDWIVISWIVIILLALFARWATRAMGLRPSGIQNVAEMLVESLYRFVASIMDEARARVYAPVVATLFIYIFCLNCIGLVPGFLSPTAKLNTTVALALFVFFWVQISAIRANGLGGYIKHLCGEPAWLAPLNIVLHTIGEVAKPLSLSIRLFGNIFGEDMVIIKLVGLAALLPIFLPIPLQFPLLCFGLFTSFVQALVFATLSAIYIAVFTEHHESHGESEH